MSQGLLFVVSVFKSAQNYGSSGPSMHSFGEPALVLDPHQWTIKDLESAISNVSFETKKSSVWLNLTVELE